MSDRARPLKQRLRTDLTTAIKARDKVRSGTLRMVLSAISEAEVAGTEAIELSDQQVLDVVIREAKKRREAEEAYAAAGRTELAEQEQAESAVLADYLPQPLSADEITDLVADAIAQTGAAELGPRGMGKVMGVVTPQTKGKADGGAVAAEVAAPAQRLTTAKPVDRLQFCAIRTCSAATGFVVGPASRGYRGPGVGSLGGSSLGGGFCFAVAFFALFGFRLLLGRFLAASRPRPSPGPCPASRAGRWCRTARSSAPGPGDQPTKPPYGALSL